MAYVDAELMLTTYIHARRGCNTVIELPANLTGAVPLVQVRRIAGGDDILTLDAPIVDIDVFHTSRASALALAELIRKDFRTNLPSYAFGGGVVAKVETVNGPYWVPYDNTNVRRYTATYRVTVHSAP